MLLSRVFCFKKVFFETELGFEEGALSIGAGPADFRNFLFDVDSVRIRKESNVKIYLRRAR